MVLFNLPACLPGDDYLEVIRVTNLVKTYNSGSIPFSVLDHVSLSIQEGEFVAIMGASGSGKSTLLQILGLLDGFDSGSYRLFGEEISKKTGDELSFLRSSRIGFIFQQFHLLARTTAMENVGLPGLYSGLDQGKERALSLLKKVGLEDRAHHKPNELSGGQQQRVAIARSLFNGPGLIFADEPTGNLDSKSKLDIILELSKLHKEGKTIVMVTHEPEMAEYCDRLIYFSDGKIIKEEKRNKPKQLETSLYPHHSQRKMSSILIGSLSSAVKTLIANRARSFLSALGILFGVAAVIAVIALGEGAKKSIEDQFSSMGSNLLIVRTGGSRSGGVSLEAGSVARIDLGDVDAIKRKLVGVLNISGTINGRGQSVYQNRNWNTMVMGVQPAYGVLRNSLPTSGRFFTELENDQRSLVALVGATVLRELFGDIDPLGKYIKINRIHFKVIGILPEKGNGGFRDQDDVILIPMQTALRRVMNRDSIDTIEMELDPNADRDIFSSDLRVLLHQRHNTNETMGNLFQIMSMADIQAAVSETSQTMSSLLMGVAGISLVVGGIGIMNIMLVSVKERTREIGLRKALGARNNDIRIQFLIESVLVSLIGGGVGVFIGVLTISLLQAFAGWTAMITTSSIGISLLFSTTIGVLFGWWPAELAAKLNPITALRYE
ncbi:ABC transporter permease [Leptospira sp. 'Mane']|uniref:ABC transporter permease n=1 Tax=Leptospira sp. 'Mane' TaxID=3387407 RepID=UPI00398AC1FD